MNKEELLQCVKKKTGESRIRFPRSGIDFQENNQIITLAMKDGMTENMQEDSAAFESWALCLKANLDDKEKSYKCCLKWNKPAQSNDRHYQRFLYRANRFKSIFGEWFFINEENANFKDDLQIKESETYFLNSPSTENEDRWNDEANNIESRLENEIIAKQDSLTELKRWCPVKLQRQLPVGLFHTPKVEAKNNAIFPGHIVRLIYGVKMTMISMCLN